MNIRQIKETCIYFKDLEKAKSFYHDLLGFEIISYVKEKHIFFRVGASVLLCFNPDDSCAKKSPPGHYGTGKYHFAFEVSPGQYLIHLHEIRSKGIVITDRVTWGNGQESFYF